MKNASEAIGSEPATTWTRRMPIGAEPHPEGVHVRVWAPDSKKVSVSWGDDSQLGKDAKNTRLESEPGGYFAGILAGASVGQCYKYVLRDGSFPDPASRYQPDGPHGGSRIVDPSAFKWTDASWRGVSFEGNVIYEMHVGTFTEAGTWRSATEELEELAALGITLIELMPVAEFAGRFGWGYDGVGLFAPTRLYGEPDEFRAFVDRAHGLGIGVILDVVYNHLGPDGNYLAQFAKDYFTDRYENDWGAALNFDGPTSAPVRELFVSNAGYWIDEFHLDGLRLDATQSIFDNSREYIVKSIADRVRAAAKGRGTYIVAENEPQHSVLVRRPEMGGHGLDSLWNDDFHHSAFVALTGRREAYFTDYRGSAQEFISAAKYGYLFQGQRYSWQKARRGTPCLDLHPANFVAYIENHDQVANSVRGDRLHALASPAAIRAVTALLLLGPATPMLFQGQEFGSTRPFDYFADHNPELAKMVANGRVEFLKQFPSIASPEAASILPDPEDEQTFRKSKLDLTQRVANARVYQLHRDLIALRRDDPLFGKTQRGGVDGAVLNSRAFVLRFFGTRDNDRILIVNLGPELQFDPAPEPLLAPPFGCEWSLLWSSEDPRYGGGGTPPLETEENWQIPAHAAMALGPIKTNNANSTGPKN